MALSKVIHVVPESDLLPHVTEGYPEVVCPCGPKVEWERGVPIVVHQSYDRRELGEEPQPAA